MDIARKNNVKRIRRCATIMGRNEEDEDFKVAQLFYPCMQCSDIFFLKADICQLGKDQRKVNMLAREYCDDVKIKNKPVIISHHMLLGLLENQEKMSKSNPDSAIFMEDTEEDIQKKIRKAYCPPTVIEKNPILDYLKHIIFAAFPYLEVKRPASDGGDITYCSYEELEKDWVEGKLFPNVLKPAVA